MKKAKSKQDLLGIKIMIGVAVTAVLLGVLIAYLYSTREPIDPVSLCKTSSAFDTHHVFVIDTTDTLSEFQSEFLWADIDQRISEASVFDRFTVFIISSDIGGISKPTFDMCKPDDGETMNPLYEGPLRARVMFEQGFYKPLARQIEKLKGLETQDTSPLVEAISDLSQLHMFDELAQSSELVFYSDLLQNSKSVSVYRDEQLPSSLVCELFAGTQSADIFMLERPNSELRQTPELIVQWRGLLGTCLNQGEKISFERVRF